MAVVCVVDILFSTGIINAFVVTTGKHRDEVNHFKSAFYMQLGISFGGSALYI